MAEITLPGSYYLAPMLENFLNGLDHLSLKATINIFPVFDHELRTNRGLKNCSVVVVVLVGD